VSVLDAIAPYSLPLSAFACVVFVTALLVPILTLGKGLSLTGWTGIVIGILSLVGTTTLVFGSAFPVLALSTLLFDVWLLVLCVLWLRSPLPAESGCD
jgi:hypothetical protein